MSKELFRRGIAFLFAGDIEDVPPSDTQDFGITEGIPSSLGEGYDTITDPVLATFAWQEHLKDLPYYHLIEDLF